MDYASNRDMAHEVSCMGYIPSYAMTADYFKKSVKRAGRSQAEYLEELRGVARGYGKIMDSQYQIISAEVPGPNGEWFTLAPDLSPRKSWSVFADSPKGSDFLAQLDSYTGIGMAEWKISLDIEPDQFRSRLMPGFELGRYDARMKVPTLPKIRFPADDYIDEAFFNQLDTYLPEFVNYSVVADHQVSSHSPFDEWVWNRVGERQYQPQSVTDTQAVLTANPAAKLLILHGYEDIATPGFQTELDLERVHLNDRVPVKWFEGGHMIYNTEAWREPLKKALAEYYKAGVPGSAAQSTGNFAAQ